MEASSPLTPSTRKLSSAARSPSPSPSSSSSGAHQLQSQSSQQSVIKVSIPTPGGMGPPKVAPQKKNDSELPPPSPAGQRRNFLASIRKKSAPAESSPFSTSFSSVSPTPSSPLSSSSSLSELFVSPDSPLIIKKKAPIKLWRKVPIGSAHEEFLCMLVYSSLANHKKLLGTRALQRRFRITVDVDGKQISQLCSAPASDKTVMSWFADLTDRAGHLLPLFCAPNADLVDVLPVARAAYDALVVKAHLLREFDEEELDAVSMSDLKREAAKLFTLSEILRLPGSNSSSFPRDRFNPYTHTASETVDHQLTKSFLSSFSIPYLLVNLTFLFLKLGGLEESGIFRINAESHALENLKRFIVTENWNEVAATSDVHVVAGAMKSFFASLSGGMLFPDLTVLGPDCSWSDIQDILVELPVANQRLIWWWVSLCRIVAAYESSNSMGLKQLVVCWSPCLHKQDLSLSSMQLISQANQTIQSVLLSIATHHPPHPLCEAAENFVMADWFPVSAADFFAQFLKREKEDFFELESIYGEVLTRDNCSVLAQILTGLPNSAWTDACEAAFVYTCQKQCFFALFEKLVEIEVESTKQLNSIFRLNSPATKMMKLLTLKEGTSFLTAVIQPFLKDLARENVDMNPATATDEIDRLERSLKLSESCTMALISITNSMSEVSPALRSACRALGRAVSSRTWPDSNAVTFAISSFFFLRFVCPSFFNVNASAPPNAVYTSKQIAKMLQQLANGGVLDQAEWPEFNVELLAVHVPRLEFFLQQLTVVPENVVSDELKKVSDEEGLNAFVQLVQTVRSSNSKVPAEVKKLFVEEK